MPRWLSRMAAEKARVFPGDRAEALVTGEPDPFADALVARSVAAQEGLAGWQEGEIDGLIAALAAQIAGHADELAAATVAETGIGCAPHKADKNRFASLGVAQSLVGKPGVGVVGRREREGLTEIAEPMGVVLGLIPVTNPVATLVFKALICIKARDALIVSCHRDAAAVGARTVDLLRQVLARHGAPADLLQSAPAPPGPPGHRSADAPPRRVDDLGHRRDGHGQGGIQLRHARDRSRAGERAGLDLRRCRRRGSRPDRGGQQGIRSRHHLRLGEQPGGRPVRAGRLHRRAAPGRRGRAHRRGMRSRRPGRLRRPGRAAAAQRARAAGRGYRRPGRHRGSGRHPPARGTRTPPGRAGSVRPGKTRPAAVAVHRRR